MEHLSHIGKYELEKFLGGGMSHVYRAKDTVLGRRVAVKILTPAGSADEEARARFLLEARMASNINHENIISVFDFGEEHGRPFIVMEFLEGESLRDAIKNGHLGSLPRRLRISLQVARALDYIHARKIIHRDVKPENIHLDSAGRIKLVDFGIAKSEGMQLTGSGFTLGTPYYMAPEQVLGKPLTLQADVYAFGILLFEVFTGQKPVTGDTVETIFHQILYEPINLDPLKRLGTPEPLCDLIARCTAKQLLQRPQHLSVVCDELETMLDAARAAASATTVTAVPIPGRAALPATAIEAPVQVARPVVNEPLSAEPAFLRRLPKALRSDTGLVLLSACGVIVLGALFYAILRVARLI